MLIGATTENPFFEVNAPLLSAIHPVAARAADRRRPGRGGGPRARRPRTPRPSRTAVAALVGLADGDARAVLTTLEVALALAGRTGPVHRRRRRAGPPHPAAALRRGRPLRPGQRVHQVDPGVGPRRRPLLAGPDARVGRGRPVHRPAPRHPGQRGRRGGRPPGPGGGRRRGPGRRVRGAARGPAQPGPGRRPPGLRTEVEPGDGGAGPGPRPTSATRPGATCPAHLRDAHYRSAAVHRPRRGLRATPTTTPGRGSTRSTGRPAVAGHVYYEPSDRGHEAVVAERLRRWRHGTATAAGCGARR